MQETDLTEYYVHFSYFLSLCCLKKGSFLMYLLVTCMNDICSRALHIYPSDVLNI